VDGDPLFIKKDGRSLDELPPVEVLLYQDMRPQAKDAIWNLDNELGAIIWLYTKYQ
jgi:hypothetical protein